MKTLRLFLFIFLGFNIHAFSQITVSLGILTGMSSTNALLSTSTTTNKYSRTMSLYTAGEILTEGGVSGTISSLGWQKGGTGEYLFNDAYIKIYLKHTTNSVWSTSPVPVWDDEVVGATEVFTSSTFSLPAGTGWKTFPFTTPFVWNGVDNICVMVEWYRPSTPTAEITWGRSTDAAMNATRVGSTSLNALVMLVNSNRPLLQLTITPGTIIPVTGVTVATQGGVPAAINTNGGTLQMTATVAPAGANQAVTWSIVNGTGTASISSTGLVTALTNGTVWAKAVSDQDATKMDSLLINISNQIVPVTGVIVSTLGGVPAIISVDGGTLQMEATVLPSNANQSVNWSIINGTGSADISSSGLVTAQTDGNVWAKAVSVQNPAIKDSLLITISNQIIPVAGVTVSTQGGTPAVISVNGGTLQMEAAITPANANQGVTWSIVPGTCTALISTSGLVTAQTNGTVWAKAVSVQDLTKKDSLQITISNQGAGFNNDDHVSGFTIYPNPVTDNIVNIEMKNAFLHPEATIIIFDITGQVIHSEQLNQMITSVKLEHLPSGMYFIEVNNDHSKYVKKFIIFR